MNNNIENKAIETSNNKDAEQEIRNYKDALGLICIDFAEIGSLADRVRTIAGSFMEEGEALIDKAYHVANEICYLVGVDDDGEEI